MRYINAYGDHPPLDPPLQSNRGQSDRAESWEQHHPKPDVPVPEVRMVTEAGGATHVPAIEPERAATSHTVLIPGRL